MFEGLDGERVSSAVVLLVSLVLVAGLLLEAADVDPDAARVGATVAGAIFVCYAVCASVYLLVRDDAVKSE
jgi:hypothetical protein